MEPGSRVRVIDSIPQEYSEGVAEFRRVEESILQCFSGKVGTVVRLDGCEDMPFIVAFSENTRVPFREFRFRPDEIDDWEAR